MSVATDATVLLVEDDENDVVLFRRAFNQAGLANPIQTVANGDDAIAYLAGQPPFTDRTRYPLPVLTLLDLKLPRRSGLEVLAWVRTQEWLKRSLVVILTSSADRGDINRAYDIGVNSYLVKPVNHDGLQKLVRTLETYWLKLNQKPDVESQQAPARSA